MLPGAMDPVNTLDNRAQRFAVRFSSTRCCIACMPATDNSRHFRKRWSNKTTGANAGGPRRLVMRTRWAARVAQFWRLRTHPQGTQPNYRTMTKSGKSKLLTNNTILWLTAMVLPVVLHFALAATKFPWPLVLPLLLFGPMLASNRMLAKAVGDTTDDSSRR